MKEDSPNNSDLTIKKAPVGLAILAMVGPSFIWAAEYIGTGEVILATRTGAILGVTILWAIVIGIFLKFWIGMSGARYTVCTGEGMMDMFDRMPGPRHWAVLVVLVVQFVAGTFSIGAVVTAAGVFVSSLLPAEIFPEFIAARLPGLCAWAVTFFAVVVVWSGVFNILKMVMSFCVLIIVVGVLYVAAHVFPAFSELLKSLSFSIPQVPAWAMSQGIAADPWKEILPLLGWGAGGFASQVWYTYWVLGAGYGATAGRGYGRPADVPALGRMTGATAQKIKGWCKVLYADATVATVIGIVVTSSFFIAGAGILRPEQVAPEGPQVAFTLSKLFSSKWGQVGGFLFILAGAAAIVSTQIGQLAGWPRLLADSFRICIPGFNRKLSWKRQFRLFLLYFLCTNMIIVFTLGKEPVRLVRFSALLDGIVLTSLQAICVAVGLFLVMPKLLSAEAWKILRPSWVFAAGLFVAFAVFTYFCIFQLPSSILTLLKGPG
jgi:Mn2+/Fe2+ NRAMP family transporter